MDYQLDLLKRYIFNNLLLMYNNETVENVDFIAKQLAIEIYLDIKFNILPKEIEDMIQLFFLKKALLKYKQEQGIL